MDKLEQEEVQRKAEILADAVGELFTKEPVEVAVAMSVLMSLTVSTGLNQAGMTGTELIRLFAQGVEKYEDAKLNEEESEEDDGEVISRTTH